MTFEQSVQFFFLLLPYFGLYRQIRENLKSNDFGIILENIIDQLDRDILYQAISIAINKNIEEVRKMEMRQVVSYLPFIIKENKLVETYFMLKQFGIFNV